MGLFNLNEKLRDNSTPTIKLKWIYMVSGAEFQKAREISDPNTESLNRTTVTKAGEIINNARKYVIKHDSQVKELITEDTLMRILMDLRHSTAHNDLTEEGKPRVWVEGSKEHRYICGLFGLNQNAPQISVKSIFAKQDFLIRFYTRIIMRIRELDPAQAKLWDEISNSHNVVHPVDIKQIEVADIISVSKAHSHTWLRAGSSNCYQDILIYNTFDQVIGKIHNSTHVTLRDVTFQGHWKLKE